MTNARMTKDKAPTPILPILQTSIENAQVFLATGYSISRIGVTKSPGDGSSTSWLSNVSLRATNSATAEFSVVSGDSLPVLAWLQLALTATGFDCNWH